MRYVGSIVMSLVIAVSLMTAFGCQQKPKEEMKPEVTQKAPEQKPAEQPAAPAPQETAPAPQAPAEKK